VSCVMSGAKDPNHISISRLLAMALSDTLVFTLPEFNHLKVCAGCFQQWSDFIKEALRDEEQKFRSR
jgi:hypothetical protein